MQYYCNTIAIIFLFQQYPDNPDQQAILIRQLQEQHYYLYNAICNNIAIILQFFFLFQQYPDNPDQQAILIRQLQEQHYYQYMQQVYQQQMENQANALNNVENYNSVSNTVDSIDMTTLKISSEEGLADEEENPDDNEGLY